MRRITHKTTKAQLALKSYNKKNLMSDEVASTVQSEINNLSDLRHPSIMRLYEVIDEFSQVHLVMELCTGIPFTHVLKKTPDQKLPVRNCLSVFR